MRLRPTSLILACALAAAAVASLPPPVAAQDGARLALEAARHQGQGNLDQALALLTEALGDTRLTNDRRAAILTDRGALLARLNQPKGAIEDFNRAVALYPEYPAIYNNRGSTLLTLGLAREAIKDFDRAILLAPGYVAAFNNRAGARMLLGQYDVAVADFTRAIELDPGIAAALTGRGRAQLAANRPLAAQRDFTHALAADNRFALAYRHRAHARLAADRPAEAIEDLSRAIAFEPANAEIYIERGNAYMQADNATAALKDYAKAIEIDAQSVPALEARALAHVKVDANNEAEADIARALELSPRAVAAMSARAILYLRTGQPDLARREAERAQKIAATHPDVLLALAEIAAASGKRDEAVQGYRAALAQRPASRDAGLALFRLTGTDERVASIEVRGAGVDHWRVVLRGGRHLAVSDQYPRLAVALETSADAPPKLVDFEMPKPPNRDIALLRFVAGKTQGAAGPEDVLNVAVLDLTQGAVLGVIPDRRGAKRAKWDWEDSRLVVAAADGLTDEFSLKGGRGQALASAQAPRRQNADGPRNYAPPAWLPFGATGPAQPQRRAGRPPKTLFDILFGN